MTELRELLADLAGSSNEPTTVQADADLARGRSALRRRRILQSATGSALVVAVAAAAIGFTTAGGPSGAPAPQAAGTIPATTASTSSFQLVAYTGKQPEGFSIDKVPAGWEVQGISTSALTLAPIGAKPHNSAEPQSDAADTDPSSFVGKVVVMLQSVDEQGTPSGEKLKVGDLTGTLVKKEGDTDGRTLYLPQPNGINVQIQVWDGIGWTPAEIADFAAGVHVNANAEPGRG